MSERSIIFLLQDIADAIHNILGFTKGFDFPQYSSDIKTKHAVQHNFMIIGEAAARIPVSYKNQHTNINWRQVKDFRNVIVHDYFGLDDNIVWDIIQLNLSPLLNEISLLLQGEKNR